MAQALSTNAGNHTEVPRIVPDHRVALVELCSFVERRLAEEVMIADDVGDDAAHSFAQTSRKLAAEMRREIDERPWAREEIGNYLLRAARQYLAHLDFRPWWG